MATIVEARYTHVGHAIPASKLFRDDIVKIYACKDCGQAVVEGRGVQKNGAVRYPNYYRKRHDEFRRKLVS